MVSLCIEALSFCAESNAEYCSSSVSRRLFSSGSCDRVRYSQDRLTFDLAFQDEMNLVAEAVYWIEVRESKTLSPGFFGLMVRPWRSVNVAQGVLDR